MEPDHNFLKEHESPFQTYMFRFRFDFFLTFWSIYIVPEICTYFVAPLMGNRQTAIPKLCIRPATCHQRFQKSQAFQVQAFLGQFRGDSMTLDNYSKEALVIMIVSTSEKI